MTTTNAQLQRLLEAHPLREPVLRTAIRALNLPPGSQGLVEVELTAHPALLQPSHQVGSIFIGFDDLEIFPQPFPGRITVSFEMTLFGHG